MAPCALHGYAGPPEEREGRGRAGVRTAARLRKMVKTLCERELVAFILVAATTRPCAARGRRGGRSHMRRGRGGEEGRRGASTQSDIGKEVPKRSRKRVKLNRMEKRGGHMEKKL